MSDKTGYLCKKCRGHKVARMGDYIWSPEQQEWIPQGPLDDEMPEYSCVNCGSNDVVQYRWVDANFKAEDPYFRESSDQYLCYPISRVDPQHERIVLVYDERLRDRILDLLNEDDAKMHHLLRRQHENGMD